jgi:hypothetical protein
LYRRQIQFLIFVATLVTLFAFVLALMNTGRQSAPPATPSLTTRPALTVTPAMPAPQRTITPTQAEAYPPPAPSTATPLPTPSPQAPATRAFFVSPEGAETNDGSRANPWPLQWVLDGPEALQPGDTIWLLEGTYTGPFRANLKGEPDAPITIRAYPGARAVLVSDDLVLDIQNTRFVNFWGLEITSLPFTRDPETRQESAYGIRIHQGSRSHDIKFINLIIHDMPAQGMGWWHANWDSEVYGALVFYNGVTQLDHGIYMRNNEGFKRVVDSIIFDNASHGIHAYGEKDYQQLNNISIIGNTVFNNGSIGYDTRRRALGGYERNILLGGYLVAQNPVIRENFTYFPGLAGQSVNLGYRAGSVEGVVEDNYFAGGRAALGGQNDDLTMLRNTFLGFTLPEISFRGNDFLVFKPSGVRVFVRPNQYEPGRANITVYNWSKQPSILLSASDLKDVQIQKGDQYALHNVQDYFDDIITGVYDGNSIEIPMQDRSVAQPVGLSFKPASTFPEFGAFVLQTLPAQP